MPGTVLMKSPVKALFLTVKGNRLGSNGMAERLQGLKEKAEINKEAGLHALRHSIATHLLQSGMELDKIKRFLGHSSLECNSNLYTLSKMSNASKYSHLKKKFTGILQQLETYLKKQNYEANTIRQFKNYTACFLDWQQSQKLEQISYNDLLIYIDYCREKGDSLKLTNRKLSAIRKYYEYLQSKGETFKNPASGLFLKGKRTSVPNNLLDKKELQELYNHYQPYDLRTRKEQNYFKLIN